MFYHLRPQVLRYIYIAFISSIYRLRNIYYFHSSNLKVHTPITPSLINTLACLKVRGLLTVTSLCKNLTDSFIIIATVAKEGSAFTLPRFITLVDADDNYLAVNSDDSLAFNKVEADPNCVFKVITLSDGRTSLKGANDKVINLYIDSETGTTGWFRCEGDPSGSGCPFDVIYANDTQIYLHSFSEPSLFFMTNYQNPQEPGLNAALFADNSCLFTVSEPKGISKET